MPAPQAISELVERFGFHREAYMRGKKNEAELRQSFIDPFFRALGWDVDNNAGYSDSYRAVALEDPIRIGGQTKFIDYAFRIGGARRFLVEAKKPSVSIRDEAGPALQIRRYAWNAGLPLSILTDFEEFAVYDCSVPVGKTDTAATARTAYFTFEEYPDRWDWIASVFSEEAIKRGSFERYVRSKADRRGTATVDTALLADIEAWRMALAKNLAIRNPSLTPEELNLAVQLIIDRILFLRICEDRGIEPYGTLQDLLTGDRVYSRLIDLFYHADDRYNSGLFRFRPENGEAPDLLTPSLICDDSVLKPIMRRLYYPESPYEFSAVPSEILGRVYEQFLGKVIRLTAGHQAKVEEKPEVRKAGGVYYTPSFVVDYIVDATLGPLVAEKTPAEVKDLAILDPACGSGSFLLGAYQFLLDWHRDWYIEHLVPVVKEKGAASSEVRALLPPARTQAKGKGKSATAPALPIIKTGPGTSRVRSEWQLTTTERKRILTSCIYGVDIDPQAVEVTKLSLLLKVLENETDETVSAQRKLFAERALPSLDRNIRCGNSLIEPDIHDHAQDLSIEERRRIAAFDWPSEFPAVLQRGGFDAVIGNPPYVRQESLGEQKEYFKDHYAVFAGTADLYAYFIERGFSLLRLGGRFGFIVPNKWLRANWAGPLRRFMKGRRIEEVIDFGDLPIFSRHVETFPFILIAANATPAETFAATTVKTLDFADLATHIAGKQRTIRVADQEDGGWSLIEAGAAALLRRIRSRGIPLDEYVKGHIYYGIKTGLNKAFVIDKGTRDRLIEEDPGSAELIRPFLFGKDVKRYGIPSPEQYLIITRRGKDIRRYQAIEAHLQQFKKELTPKPPGWKGEKWPGRKPGTYKWFETQDAIDYIEEFDKPKFIFPDISLKPNFMFDQDGVWTCTNTCYFIVSDDRSLLGLLNSRLYGFLYQHILPVYRTGYLRFFRQYVEEIPIPVPDPKDTERVAVWNRIGALVGQRLELKRARETARSPQDLAFFKRELVALDARIDRAVYDLFGLTPDEIAIVEAPAETGAPATRIDGAAGGITVVESAPDIDI